MNRLAEVALGGLVGAALTATVMLVAGVVGLTSDFGLGVTTGVVSSAVVVLILGIIRAPQLVLELGEVADGDYPNARVRFVHVNVRNPELRAWRWQLRRPATFCRAELAFGDLGSAAPRFTIDGRWRACRARAGRGSREPHVAFRRCPTFVAPKATTSSRLPLRKRLCSGLESSR